MKFDIEKITKKMDLKKIALVVGAVILIIVVYRYLKSAIEKWQEKNAQDLYLKQIESEVDEKNLSFRDFEYQDMADKIKQYLSENTWSGWQGVDEDGIYTVMSRLKTLDDLEKLHVKFGMQTLRRRWHTASGTYTLPEAFAFFLDGDERGEINRILKENGIDYEY